MSVETLPRSTEPYGYLLRTNTQLRRRVICVANKYGMSFNAALNLLLVEALDARQIPEE